MRRGAFCGVGACGETAPRRVQRVGVRQHNVGIRDDIPWRRRELCVYGEGVDAVFVRLRWQDVANTAWDLRRQHRRTWRFYGFGEVGRVAFDGIAHT